MPRINAIVYDKHIDFLQSQSENISEIVRRALDDYELKIRNINVSASASKSVVDPNLLEE